MARDDEGAQGRREEGGRRREEGVRGRGEERGLGEVRQVSGHGTADRAAGRAARGHDPASSGPRAAKANR